MKPATFKLLITQIFILLLAIQVEYSYAYLDPGTGSYFIQIAIGAILGGIYALKIFWGKIKNIIGNIFTKK